MSIKVSHLAPAGCGLPLGVSLLPLSLLTGRGGRMGRSRPIMSIHLPIVMGACPALAA